MEEEAKIFSRLNSLKGEHRELDQKITVMLAQPMCNQLELRRLKKRKLQLRDVISHLESEVYPDIIA